MSLSFKICMFGLRETDGWGNEYLCIGVEHQGKVIIPKHYESDDALHYSAGICPSCVMVHKRMKDIDRFAFDVFVCNGLQGSLKNNVGGVK